MARGQPLSASVVVRAAAPAGRGAAAPRSGGFLILYKLYEGTKQYSVRESFGGDPPRKGSTSPA